MLSRESNQSSLAATDRPTDGLDGLDRLDRLDSIGRSVDGLDRVASRRVIRWSPSFDRSSLVTIAPGVPTRRVETADGRFDSLSLIGDSSPPSPTRDPRRRAAVGIEGCAARVSARRAATSVDARARGDVDVDVDGDDDVVDVFVARVARRVRVARDDDEDGARADRQTRAPRAARSSRRWTAAAARDRSRMRCARARVFLDRRSRGRRGDRVEAALARGVERGWRPARARARDGAWGNLMGSSYPSGLRAKRGRRTRGDSCGTEGWW